MWNDLDISECSILVLFEVSALKDLDGLSPLGLHICVNHHHLSEERSNMSTVETLQTPTQTHRLHLLSKTENKLYMTCRAIIV